ncbi:MAG: hypothetical protein FWE67_08325, partial [Planctomycetaceae bacterium]|nr:hypothetical protein [Planctomycetaceae bacterium]
MKHSILCSVFCVLAFCVSVSAQRYCPKSFEERLQQDYLRQDGAAGHSYFTDAGGNTLETALVNKVLTEVPAQEFRQHLADLATVPGNAPAWKALYFDCCKERRKNRLQIVHQNYPVLIFTKHQVLGGSHYAYTEAPSDAQFPERRDMLGGKLLALNINADGTTTETLLLEVGGSGNLRDPDVSYDAAEIVFSMRSDILKDDYHLYKVKINDAADITAGISQPMQLTFGPGFADVEPCFLPDGNILFNSTRCMQIVDCWWTDVTNLYVIDGEGRFMRRYGFDQVHTNYPKTLSDGRVIFTRWDYNDRGQIFPQGLFVMNYDGTAKTEYYGNNSYFPTTVMHAREIPNSSKLVALASGHHNDQRGKLIIIDRSKGTQENEGAQLIAPIRETKAERIDAYGQDGEQFQYPLAIDEENFIVTYTPDGFQGRKYDIPFGIYYMDIHNRKRELLAWDPVVSCAQTVPLKPRTVPMLRYSPVDYTQKTGIFYVQNVYEGPGLAGVEQGTIKELRIVALEFRAAGIEKNGNRGPAGGALVSTPIA